MPSPRFQAYEIVRVTAANPELAEIHGARGVILGRADPADGTFSYAVLIGRDGCCWQVDERDLAPTGEVSSREAFYGDTALRVRVDAQGRGWPVSDPSPETDA